MPDPNLRITRRIVDEPYGWTAAYQASIEPERVALKLRVQLQPGPGVTAADLTQVQLETTTGVARYYDQRFVLQEAGAQQRPVYVKVEFVTSDPDLRVVVHAGSGRDNLQHWFVNSGVTARAHEVGHALGLKDEYVDPIARSRANVGSAGVYQDHSLMGDFHQEGAANAELKPRHAEEIIRDLNVSLGRDFRAVLAENASLAERSSVGGSVSGAKSCAGATALSIQTLREMARAFSAHSPGQDRSTRLRT